MAIEQDRLITYQKMLEDASYIQLQVMLDMLIHEMKISAAAIRQGSEGWED